MINFCTLFDSKYLSRGLVMYDSLVATGTDFHLYIFAFDEIALTALKEINLYRVSVISLSEFENEELLAVKDSRTRAEYCWTSTSSIIEYVFQRFNVPFCIYLDADLFFYRSPEVLLEEFPDNKSVLITEHSYSRLAGIFEGRRAGRFCVQFILFRNNYESRRILGKWISQCINWCYARYEDGKFGDQKYLDTWPDEYESVHILQHRGGGVAPWNVRRYRLIENDNGFALREKRNKKEFELVFYHFHYVRFQCDGTVDLGWNRLQKKILRKLYLPYIILINQKEKFLKDNYSYYKTSYSSNDFHSIKGKLKYLIKRIARLNILKKPLT